MNIGTTVPGTTGDSTISDPSIKNRLLTAARTLFADKGYAGTSVREICAAADASIPMIHHYFGNKEGLYRAVLDEFSATAFQAPMRLIAGDPKSRDEFRTKLELFISETFQVMLAQAPVMRIMSREKTGMADLADFHTAFANFLHAGQDRGFVRPGLRIEMVTGLMMDRLGMQILFALDPNYPGPNVLTDQAYRHEWLAANIDALLYGLAS